MNAALPVFGCVSVHREPLAEGVAGEAAWMASCAATGRAAAHLWQGRPGFVVPRRYTTLPGWPAAAARHAVQVRTSGGALVPQGPGVWNLSLVWPAPTAAPTSIDAIYHALCAELTAALARLEIVASAQAVEGSFCDGRYNLAVDGRKLVGTAQAWRRVDGRALVLAHAVLVLDADPAALTAQANAFEEAMGQGRPYRADALTSVARSWCRAHGVECAPPGLPERCLQLLAQQFARLLPPRVSADPNP